MLRLIQDNLNTSPKTLYNLTWEKIIYGIPLDNKELEYLEKYKIKDIIEFGLVEDGCWVVDSYGFKYWYKYGKLHRNNGPAIEGPTGYKLWYKYGKLHREDGPAVESLSSCKRYYYKEFWIYGKRQD